MSENVPKDVPAALGVGEASIDVMREWLRRAMSLVDQAAPNSGAHADGRDAESPARRDGQQRP